ncbi:MAG: hypothetical protein PVI90_03170 [Desulfobacteraceae bacterium]|jgi:protein-tyrosine phosphatase
MQSIRNFLKLIIKGYLRDFIWNFYGRRYFQAKLPQTASSFLFICKGNICRSAFAHYMAEKLSTEKSYVMTSAGIKVTKPEKSPDDAIAAAEAFGISLHAHRSVPISLDMCRKADMILVMEAWQLVKVREQFPEFDNRVFLLSQFEHNVNQRYNGWEKYNILDPYGKGCDAFQNCFQRIERCLAGLLKQTS